MNGDVDYAKKSWKQVSSLSNINSIAIRGFPCFHNFSNGAFPPYVN